MSHENWDDQHIEQLLSDMPKVEDKRTKEEVYKRLHEEGGFKERPVKKKRIKWLPLVVTIAALFALAFIIPPFLNNNHSSEEFATNSVMDSSQEKSSVEEQSNGEMYSMTMISTSLKTSVYPLDMEQSILFPVEIINETGEVIPISILIDKERVVEDFGEHQTTNDQLYNRYAQLLDIEAIGVSVTGLSLRTQQSNEQQTNYFLTTLQNGSQFLVPHLKLSIPTVIEALEQMEYEVSDELQSVILPKVDYTVSESDGVVHVIFSNTIDLTQYDAPKAMQMIEGILLTAASFGKQVQFENILQSEWEGFNFTTPLPIPIGANKMPFIVVQ